MITQSTHDSQVMKTIEAIVESFGGSVTFTLTANGYSANINFPDSVSRAQELACGNKVAATIKQFGGKII